MILVSKQYEKDTGIKIHKVVLLREVFNAKPGKNKLYRTASKLYDKLIDCGIL